MLIWEPILNKNISDKGKKMENSQIEDTGYDERLEICSFCHMNPCMCEEIDRVSIVLPGDAYCIKHQELLTPGLEFDSNGNQLNTCPYCEWGDI